MSLRFHLTQHGIKRKNITMYKLTLSLTSQHLSWREDDSHQILALV